MLQRSTTGRSASSFETGRPDRRAFGIALAVVCAFLAVTVAASWSTNVLAGVANGGPRQALQVLVPQGWAFFTKSPEGITLVPYVKTGGAGWKRADSLPQSSAANGFGLSRNQRAQSTELAIIAAAVPKFTSCEDYLTACLRERAGETVTVQNQTNTQHFCGVFRIVQQEPVKWAYRDAVPESVRVARFADVKVECP
ncbi:MULTISPECIES: SdpA family antimicrobial peptide system protein [unclassified Curtobacterium]|uniref:SdpA family antimicrobial peptide system protein n=1 Tax=unclassified Curtobacterium TaxID=257496 RepID=UPI00381AE619